MRHFLADDDLTSDEQREVLAQAAAFKANRFLEKPFAGPQSVALIFDKPTLRTQVSFSVGVAELGGYPLLVDGSKAMIGTRESVADVARVLGRQVSAIVWRTYGQENLEQMAKFAQVPVVNALSDDYHPCQILADLLTIAEHLKPGDGPDGLFSQGPALAGVEFAYVGDGANNMAHSYLLGGALAGMNVRIGAPEGFMPREDIIHRAQAIADQTGGSVIITDDPGKAVAGAQAVATDTWVSMGQEAQADQREQPFWPFQVNDELLAQADSEAIVLHCLPAYRGKEITSEVIEGSQSVVWDEAENRLHVQKGVMSWLMGQQ